MKLEAPQVIFVCMSLIGMGINMARYGQPKKGTYDLVDVLVAPALLWALLWYGGFFG